MRSTNRRIAERRLCPLVKQRVGLSHTARRIQYGACDFGAQLHFAQSITALCVRLAVDQKSASPVSLRLGNFPRAIAVGEVELNGGACGARFWRATACELRGLRAAPCSGGVSAVEPLLAERRAYLPYDLVFRLAAAQVFFDARFRKTKFQRPHISRPAAAACDVSLGPKLHVRFYSVARNIPKLFESLRMGMSFCRPLKRVLS